MWRRAEVAVAHVAAAVSVDGGDLGGGVSPVAAPQPPPDDVLVHLGEWGGGGAGKDEEPRHPSLEGPGSPKVLPMESVMAIFCLLARQTDWCYSSWILIGTY